MTDTKGLTSPPPLPINTDPKHAIEHAIVAFREIVKHDPTVRRFFDCEAFIKHELEGALGTLSAPSAIRTKVCRTDGRCQYAIDHGAEGMGHCPVGKCAMPAEAAPSPLYAGNVFMIDGRLHRTCDCSPSINKCARGLPRTLLTTEFGRCMVPV
jgi:hypothetical protein